MKSIYGELLDAVDKGKRFKVDLMEKSLWINKKQIIKKGEIVNEQDQSKEFIKEYDLALEYGSFSLSNSPWEVIEVLYTEFKKSVPGEHSNRKSYFKALPVDELTDAELAYGTDRDYAQARIEGYVLLASLIGWLKWEHGTHWFYQSPSDSELIVLRNWIE